MLANLYGNLIARQERLAQQRALCRQDGRNILARFILAVCWFALGLLLFGFELPLLLVWDARELLLRLLGRGRGESTRHMLLVRRVAGFRRPACAGALLAVLVLAAGAFLLPGRNLIEAATQTWVQTDWVGGADTAAIANTTNAAGGIWTKFFSKTANVNVSTAGQVSLTSATSTINQTTDDEFKTGNVPLGLRVVDGAVTMKKQDGRPCTLAAECASAVCTIATGAPSGYCGSWYYNVCANIAIYSGYSSYSQWMGSPAACVPPQCSSGALVYDNTVDFSLYGARNDCKSKGGRLPTLAELTCMSANKAVTGGYCSYFWSNQEYDAASAYRMDMSAGTSGTGSKNTSSSNVCHRCVKDVR